MAELTALHTLTAQMKREGIRRLLVLSGEERWCFEHALKLFEVDHDYDASLEEISYALETVEPGVTDRFVSSYEKTREQIRM